MGNVSKLMLGTAQLGGKYGIANVVGMPTKQECCDIIQHALSSGVESFDTAPGYGESEVRIGECLKELSHMQTSARVVTKIPSVHSLGLATEKERNRFVLSTIMASLKNLHRCQLDIVLLHDPKDMTLQNGEILKLLLDLKNRNVIKKIGVSIYDINDIDVYLELGCFDSIQVPINIFDQRLLGNGLMEKLSRKDIEVFARSIYLQGLLLMDPENLPTQLRSAKKPLELLAKLSIDTRMPIKELSLLFVRDLPGLSKIIVGCETKDQLIDNLTLIEKPPLKEETIREIYTLFSNIPIEIIDPRMWN